jgi:hypothetical protein
MRPAAVVLLGLAVILGVAPAGAQEKYTMGMAGAT